jgi:opacity protein-like surface antigen
MNLLKHFAVASIAALASVGAATAQDAPAEDNWGLYVRADAGWSLADGWGEDGSAFVGGGGIGYQFGDWFRADVTADYSGSYSFLSYWYGFSSFTTVLGNAYLDIPTGTFVTPYVGGGAGAAFAGGDSGFAYDFTGGLAFEISDGMAVDIGYRYININADPDDITAHQGLAGIRFGF